MENKNYIIQKYKPLYTFSLRKPYTSSIYGIMVDRGYQIFNEIDIEGEKISNYTKYVEKYLEEHNASGDNFYMWYVKYPKQLLDVKTLIIFKKPITINHMHDLTDVVNDGRY